MNSYKAIQEKVKKEREKSIRLREKALWIYDIEKAKTIRHKQNNAYKKCLFFQKLGKALNKPK